MGAPESKFGWTFFQLIIQPPLQSCIEAKFADMLGKYRFSKKHEKLAKFLGDYLNAKDCNVKIRLIDY